VQAITTVSHEKEFIALLNLILAYHLNLLFSKYPSFEFICEISIDNSGKSFSVQAVFTNIYIYIYNVIYFLV